MKEAGWIVALVLGVLLLFKHCNEPEITQHTETVYVHDTNTYTPPATKPKPVISIIKIPVYTDGKDSILPIDTCAVVSAYYTAHYYIDTLASDTNITAWLHDSVWQNHITYRQFAYRLNRPTAIITNTYKVEERAQLYAGVALQLGFTGEFSPAVGPQLFYKTQSSNLYHAGLLISPVGYGIQAGAAFKLSFKKGK